MGSEVTCGCALRVAVNELICISIGCRLSSSFVSKMKNKSQCCVNFSGLVNATMHSARIISLRIQKVVLALGILSYWHSSVLFSWGFVNLCDDFTEAVYKHNAQTSNEFNKVLFITKAQLVVVLCGSSHWFPQFLCVVPMTGSQFMCLCVWFQSLVPSFCVWFQWLVPRLSLCVWFQSLVPIVSLCGSNDGFSVSVCVWFWSLVCIAFCVWLKWFIPQRPAVLQLAYTTECVIQNSQTKGPFSQSSYHSLTHPGTIWTLLQQISVWTMYRSGFKLNSSHFLVGF